MEKPLQPRLTQVTDPRTITLPMIIEILKTSLLLVRKN